MAEQPVTIERQPDGRHAVLDAKGKVLGKHNSVFSAARQMHEYHGPTTPDPHPPVPRPQSAAPTKTAQGKPSPIPRP